MTLSIVSTKDQHRGDNTLLPIFSISGFGSYPFLYIKDILYRPFPGTSYTWQPPNETANLDVTVRDLILSNWVLSPDTSNVSNNFTKVVIDGFSGAFADPVTGDCAIHGKPANTAGTYVFALQSGTPSHEYDTAAVEHALIMGQSGLGSIREKGVIKPVLTSAAAGSVNTGSFKWETGDMGLIERVGSVVRYWLVKPDGRIILLRSKRTDMAGDVIPTLTIYHAGGVCNLVRVWAGAEASIPLYLAGALRDFQDWENQAGWESLAEKTMNKDKSEDFTYFTEEKNVMTLSINIRWDDIENYSRFLEFWKYHDISREFIFVDEARKKEFFAKFISSFKDNPLGADTFGMSVDLRQMVNPPAFYDFYVPPDTTPPIVNFTAPDADAFVSASLTISATASDDSGVDRVEFYYNAGSGYVLIGSDSSAPYSVVLNTISIPDGPITLKAIGFDTLGNPEIALRMVIVRNGPPDPYKPDKTTIISTTGTSATKFTVKVLQVLDPEADGVDPALGDDDLLVI